MYFTDSDREPSQGVILPGWTGPDARSLPGGPLLVDSWRCDLQRGLEQPYSSVTQPWRLWEDFSLILEDLARKESKMSSMPRDSRFREK